jgi:hypothetical protein
MSRREEIDNLKEGQEAVWLAGQLDDLEKTFILKLDRLNEGLDSLRRVLVGILISIVIALVAVPVGIIWAVATGPK